LASFVHVTINHPHAFFSRWEGTIATLGGRPYIPRNLPQTPPLQDKIQMKFKTPVVLFDTWEFIFLKN
jgi:hypothetical protein